MTEPSANFLIVTWPGGGNVPPALALGRRLVAARHRASVTGPDPLAGAVRAAGLRFRPCPAVAPWPDGVAFEDDPARFDAIRNAPQLAADLLAVIDAEAPSALVVDCMMGAGLAAADRAELPTAALIHVLYQPFCELWGPLYVHTAAARAALGLPPVDVPDPVGSMTSVDLLLALVPPGFDYPSPSAAPTPCYIGPILEPACVEAAARNTDDGKHGPLVLISFGTTAQTQHQVLHRVLEAAADLPVQGLLTLGGLPLTPGIPAPPNVTVHDFLPHSQVMHRVSAVVCHGGLSTIMAALATGVPLVCLPQGREQGFNARTCPQLRSRAGAAR